MYDGLPLMTMRLCNLIIYYKSEVMTRVDQTGVHCHTAVSSLSLSLHFNLELASKFNVRMPCAALFLVSDDLI